jgi:glycosyltransferase involved in cell wall biosynthesis
VSTILRVVLDQIGASGDSDLAMASVELARALVSTVPTGCLVEAIVPAGDTAVADAVPGLVDVERMPVARREMLAGWSMGLPVGAGGLLHSPTLAAPLVKHDRMHDHDQTVVTVWDLRAWESPDELPRPAVMWHRAMLKRAARHADAVVVPTHAAAERLAGLSRFGDRIRVVSGAPPEDFRVPSDEVGRRRHLGLPEGFVLLAGSAPPDGLDDAFRGIAAADRGLPVVVVDAPAGGDGGLVGAAASAGMDPDRVHVLGALQTADRAAVLGGAVAFLAPSRVTRFPWRLVEALRVGVPVIASDTDVHREVLVDGGLLAVDAAGYADALTSALGSAAAVERLAVMAADRGRAFGWADAAQRIWQLHADL